MAETWREWREPADLAADALSGDPARVLSGLAGLFEFTKDGDEVDIPALEPWVLAPLGLPVPDHLVIDLARFLSSYRSFVPQPSRAHVVRQLVELSVRHGVGQVVYETALEVQGMPDPPAVAADTVRHLNARGLREPREVEAAARITEALMWAKQPVRHAVAVALAGLPDNARRRAMLARVLPLADPDDLPLLRAPGGRGDRVPARTFQDTAVQREERYSIGVEARTGCYYLSIPVRNVMVDLGEYYELDPQAYQRYRADLDSALPFVRRCRARLEDARLFHQPSLERGTPT